MPQPPKLNDEQAAVDAERTKAYFAEAGLLNLTGALVFTLLVAIVIDRVPLWTWLPALMALYGITALRWLHERRFKRRPESRPSTWWLRRQTLYSALAGICWGLGSTALLAHLPDEYHAIVLAVAAVSAAASSSQGFACHHPAGAFLVGTLLPPTLWLPTVGDRSHSLLAIMLFIFIPLTISMGRKRNRVFIEAQRMRFRNEALAVELLRQRDVAEQAQAAKGRFLAAASHDLRQPMQALSIFLELLQREKHTETTANLLGRTQQAANAMMTLLNALLDISRLDAGIVKANRRPLAAQELLDGMAQEFAPVAERQGLRLRVAPCSATIESDPVLLGQILRNLIANAIRYTPKGAILVGCRRRGEQILMGVWDTGVGIAADQHEAVFREFYQIGNKERKRENGLGLGLAIVDRIARLLEHPLSLRSPPGKGTCFLVGVPRRAHAPAAVPPAAELSPADRLLAGRHIVLIEDDRAIQEGLRTLLEDWGCQVSAAASLVEAEEIIGDGIPAAVVSDMALPGGTTGIGAIAALRRRYGPTLPALLVTGDTSQETLNAASTAGLLMLHKPIRPARLRAALSSLLNNGAA